MLSFAGGLLGVAAGIVASHAVANVMQWQTNVSSSAIAVAFGCAAVIGVGFGYYPALQASRLDPIDALRHE
jgi:putative ABC transport system permease protein